MPALPSRDKKRLSLAIAIAMTAVFAVACIIWWEPVLNLMLLAVVGLYYGPLMVLDSPSLSMGFQCGYAVLWLLSVAVIAVGARYRRRWWGWIVGGMGVLALGLHGIIGMGMGF